MGGPQLRRKKTPSPAHTFVLKATYPILLIQVDGDRQQEMKMMYIMALAGPCAHITALYIILVHIFKLAGRRVHRE